MTLYCLSRCESNQGRDEVYKATFGNKEETGLTLHDDDITILLILACCLGYAITYNLVRIVNSSSYSLVLPCTHC